MSISEEIFPGLDDVILETVEKGMGIVGFAQMWAAVTQHATQEVDNKFELQKLVMMK
jgi:hypothetical protein